MRSTHMCSVAPHSPLLFTPPPRSRPTPIRESRYPTPMELIAIDPTGAPEDPLPLDTFARGACFACARNYARTGYAPPWIGYLAVEDDEVVGSCTFRAPPERGRVEIGYHTSPAHEGRGVASRMAKLLVALAREADPSLALFARTQEPDNASTKVLQRAGFTPLGPKPDVEDGVAWEWELAPATRRLSHDDARRT